MLKLKEILAKEAKDLNDDEKAFLKEHAAEITEAADKEKFKEFIGTSADDGLDVDSIKALLAAHAKEAIAAANDEEKKALFAKKADEIAEEIAQKFVKGVEDSRKKAMDAGIKHDEKGQDVTRKFFKAFLANDFASCKALTTDANGVAPDDTRAGLLIPQELMNEVLRIAEKQYGLARRDFLYLPFSGPGNERQIPTLGTSVRTFWVGEKQKISSTQPKFGIVTQTLKKLGAMVPLTSEILEDSLVDINGLLGELFAEAIAKEEDIQFFAGTGFPWTGLLYNQTLNQVIQNGSAAQINVDELIRLEDATSTGALAGAKYYMHRTVLSALRQLKDKNGRYILVDAANGFPATLNNRPYETSDAFPELSTVRQGDPYILFGNLKKTAAFGDKQQIRIKLLDQATITDTDDSTQINLAEQDCVALRVIERVGYVVTLGKSSSVLVAGAPSSP